MHRHSTRHWVRSSENKETEAIPLAFMVHGGRLILTYKAQNHISPCRLLRKQWVPRSMRENRRKGVQWGGSSYFIRKSVRKALLKEILFKLK